METAFCANAAPAEGQAVCLASTNARSRPQRARWPRIFPAWAAEVVSSNIVGYSKLELANGYTMVGSAFLTVGGQNSISVQEIKASGLAGIDWDTFDLGDTLMIWDASQQGYLTTLYYAGDVQTESMTANGVTAGTWFDMDNFVPATTEIPVGGAFWIVTTNGGTLTFK